MVNLSVEELTERVLAEVRGERRQQDAKWGVQNHPDLYPGDPRHNYDTYADQAEYWHHVNDERIREQAERGTPLGQQAAWDSILLEEVYEALSERDSAALRAELIQVAAVALGWIECIDRRTTTHPIQTTDFNK